MQTDTRIAAPRKAVRKRHSVEYIKAIRIGLMAGHLLLAGTPGQAHAQDVRSGLAKSVWTAEAIRNVRAENDYRALMALVVTHAATKANLYASPDALKQAIARAQQIADATPRVSLDPDLNPATFREMLRRLHNSGVLPPEILNDLIRELSRSPADLTEEEAILREVTVATKATFATFMQQHVMAVYDAADNVRVRSVLLAPLGRTTLPDPRTELVALINQSHLPAGPVKSAILEIASSGTVDAERLKSAAAGALNSAATHFETARNAFQAIASGQPRFDTILSAAIPPSIQTRVAAARQLISSTPDQLAQFDTLRTMANLLPLPPSVSNAIQTVAQIGSTIESTVSTVAHVASSLGSLGNLAGVGLSFLTTGGIGALAGSLGSILGGGGPSNQEILDAVNRVGQQVEQLHSEMVSRFDQVDRELRSINVRLDAGFAALGAQLADLRLDLRAVAATTSAIETTLLEERDTLQRAVINNIGSWNDSDLRELHRNLVELVAAVDRADAHADDLTQVDFRRLVRYFTTLARSEAGTGALTGLQAAETYDLGFAATRLSRQSALYPVNYALSFPVQGPGSPTFQALLGGTEGTRNVVATPYVNERVWAIAANALATMLERWPAFAKETPGLRDGFDGVVKNGKDLEALVKAVQRPEALPNSVLSKPYAAAFEAYQSHTQALSQGLGAAIGDEARSFASTQRLRPDQTASLINAFLARGTLFNPPSDAIAGGLAFVRSKFSFTLPAVAATGCDGEKVPRTIDGTPLTGYGLQAVREAVALNIGVLSACVTIPYYVDQRVITQDHGGYGIQGHGAPCAANTEVTQRTFGVVIRFMFRLASAPDIPANRVVVAEAAGVGPWTDVSGKIIGRAHWSGQPTAQGHDWNSECRVWRTGETNGFYVGDEAYMISNWAAINATFASSAFANGTFPHASGNRQAILEAARAQADGKLLSIYANLASDLTAVLNQPAPAPQARITGVTAIANAVRSLEGLRALLRELTTIGYETTLARDDVLNGLLYGTDSLPGGTELLEAVSVCAHGHLASPLDSCLSGVSKLPALRMQRFAQRLSLVNTELQAGRTSDSHRLIDATLDRLGTARCLVPLTYNGRPDCNVQH